LNDLRTHSFAATRASTLNGNDAMAWYNQGGSLLMNSAKSDEAQEAYGNRLELEIILGYGCREKEGQEGLTIVLLRCHFFS